MIVNFRVVTTSWLINVYNNMLRNKDCLCYSRAVVVQISNSVGMSSSVGGHFPTYELLYFHYRWCIAKGKHCVVVWFWAI